jgi:hypothetical protein
MPVKGSDFAALVALVGDVLLGDVSFEGEVFSAFSFSSFEGDVPVLGVCDGVDGVVDGVDGVVGVVFGVGTVWL